MNPNYKIYELLTNNINNLTGKINFNMAGISFNVNAKDIVGNVLQSWIEQWLIQNNIKYVLPANTQSFPDFIIYNNSNESFMLEIKTFNDNASPAFDIANFDSYCSSLLNVPQRIYADYLILSYDMQEDGTLTIKNIWLKKVWEITGQARDNPITMQIKRGMAYNIRPRNWYKGENVSFRSKEEFILALYEQIKKQHGTEKGEEWITRMRDLFVL